jgi:hypothetical protein
VGEIVSVVVLATVSLIMLIIVLMSRMNWHDGDNARETFSSTTNREHVVDGKNVSDAAGDWLMQ